MDVQKQYSTDKCTGAPITHHFIRIYWEVQSWLGHEMQSEERVQIVQIS